MRWDLDGSASNNGYAAAFLNAALGIGCVATCEGHDLTANLGLDFSAYPYSSPSRLVKCWEGRLRAFDHDSVRWKK